MDALTDNELDKALRSASDRAAREEASSIVSVARSLRRELSGPDDPLAAVVAALEYHPVTDPTDSDADPSDIEPSAVRRSPFEALLGHIDADAFVLWSRALAHSPRPLVAARFADLLWCVRYGDTAHEWGQRAVDAYLASVYDHFGHVLEISEGLQRALEIATQIDDGPRAAAVVAALAGLAKRSIDGDHRSSGVALSIIDFFAERQPLQRPSDLAALLDLAIDTYRDDAFLLESALDIKAKLVEPAEREQWRSAAVEAVADLARHSDDQFRYAAFHLAIDLARRHGLLARAEQLRAELDSPPESMVEQLPDPRAEFVDSIVGDDDVRLALARFGGCIPTDTQNGDPAHDVADRLTFFGALAVEILARARDHYGSLTAAEPWFVTELIDHSAALRIGRTMELYEAGDFDAAASVLVSRLERLIHSIDGAVAAPSGRYLRAILAYGTPNVASAPDAALLLHAACHLRLLETKPTTPGP
jgi:hypothetical protein